MRAPTINDLTFFPIIAAAAACRAVSAVCGVELAIKWPNDLIYKLPPSLRDTPLKEGGGTGYKKICGILTEASVAAENGVSYVIVGIGINVNNDICDFPDGIKNTASSLKIISGKKYNRAGIICETVSEFTRLLYVPREELLDEYKKRLLLDIAVSFAQNGGIFKGRAVGINENGNLVAQLESGEETVIQSGEINFIFF
jgi:BirA family biotin operon repressor/biotin-[acetyl-CoA-carboxylase] ligase